MMASDRLNMDVSGCLFICEFVSDFVLFFLLLVML